MKQTLSFNQFLNWANLREGWGGKGVTGRKRGIGRNERDREEEGHGEEGER